MGVMTEKASPQLITTEFDRWWNSSGIWVEPANKRRGGESGVQLLQQRDLMRPPLYCKRQVGHTYRTLLHPFGRPTILRELQAYRAFARLGIKTPNVVYCTARQQHGTWQALLVTEALQGFVSLEQWYAVENSAALAKAVLIQLAATLARLHLAGWQHGCCYPKHIFVKSQVNEGGTVTVEIALLDLEKSRRRLRIKDAARRDLGQLGRHRGNMPETDLLLIHQAYQQALNNPAGVLQP
ncbi:lipopolysaccharide kinase InaA family protein [Pseudomonas sp.]|uniref:lipopolysaccharide kinase InaA family protein n=1 Tax=Pseudomonas sp. TaxID=306 RepID=UPI003BB5392C